MKLQHYFFAFLASLLITTPAMAQAIESGTSVQITIMGVPAEEKGKVDALYPVSNSGTVNLPFIGKIYAAGKSPESLSSTIQNAYRKAEIYTNPTIQVVSTAEGATVSEQLVHIGGQVRRPGPVKYSKNLTIYQAVQSAGGATEFGSLKRVHLYRNGKQETLDLTEAEYMRKSLRPNDTVTVPQKNIFGQ
jgi:polysaccharide export outer membrane protein